MAILIFLPILASRKDRAHPPKNYKNKTINYVLNICQKNMKIIPKCHISCTFLFVAKKGDLPPFFPPPFSPFSPYFSCYAPVPKRSLPSLCLGESFMSWVTCNQRASNLQQFVAGLMQVWPTLLHVRCRFVEHVARLDGIFSQLKVYFINVLMMAV